MQLSVTTYNQTPKHGLVSKGTPTINGIIYWRVGTVSSKIDTDANVLPLNNFQLSKIILQVLGKW